MQYVTFTECPDPLCLIIKLLPAGREYLEEQCLEEHTGRVGTYALLADLCEHQLCNGWDVLSEEDKRAIGALTGCDFILTRDVERDEDGKLLRCAIVYWNPYYAVEDEIAILQRTGEIRLTGVA